MLGVRSHLEEVFHSDLRPKMAPFLMRGFITHDGAKAS